jgi:hypothetical protein
LIGLFQVAKVLSLVLIGFFGHVFVIGKTVDTVLDMMGGAVPAPVVAATKAPKDVKVAAPKQPFSAEILKMYLSGTVLFGALSIAAQNNGNEWATTLRNLFTSCATLAGFVLGSRMPSHITKVAHPLFWSTAGSWIAAWLYGE